MNNLNIGDIIKAPSGDNVEILEFKDSIVIVYQLDSNCDRITIEGINGKKFLKGIITLSKLV